MLLIIFSKRIFHLKICSKSAHSGKCCFFPQEITELQYWVAAARGNRYRALLDDHRLTKTQPVSGSIPYPGQTNKNKSRTTSCFPKSIFCLRGSCYCFFLSYQIDIFTSNNSIKSQIFLKSSYVVVAAFRKAFFSITTEINQTGASVIVTDTRWLEREAGLTDGRFL